ncbi:hypothetical protein [Staphylococcus caeli]|uniref:Uncharacterized protein n=1 Tax=Staphylococcus caeli TaxID=2201815 RepID=A0A1D4PIC6_9STAP|nr:hypothetical protein [Staphylococcus caeli]SCT00788.1 Uncharacterised protein [Staphylococcus caeli]SCT22683.1 Uncharacterised protein [Staphylococcus caeli]
MSLFLKILIGILFVSIASWNNTISTQKKVNKRADKQGTEPMTGKQFRFMLFLNIVMTTGFYILLITTVL